MSESLSYGLSAGSVLSRFYCISLLVHAYFVFINDWSSPLIIQYNIHSTFPVFLSVMGRIWPPRSRSWNSSALCFSTFPGRWIHTEATVAVESGWSGAVAVFRHFVRHDRARQKIVRVSRVHSSRNISGRLVASGLKILNCRLCKAAQELIFISNILFRWG